MRTRRTTKFRAITIAKQPALIADLASVRRIDKGNCQTIPFGSINYALNHQIVAKAIQLPSRALSNMLFLGRSFNFKILKYKNSIFGSPLTKLRGSFSTKCFCLITLLPLRPKGRSPRARIRWSRKTNGYLFSFKPLQWLG